MNGIAVALVLILSGAIVSAQDDASGTGLERARAQQEQVLDSRLQTLPPDHQEIQEARQDLAITLCQLGDLEGARRLFEQVLEVKMRLLPEDHPNVAQARHNLAIALHSLGDLDASRALREQVLAAREAGLPDDHPDLQSARLNLAVSVKAAGDLERARALEEQVLEVYSRTLPEDHHDLLVLRGNLGITLLQLGDLEGARALQERVLALRSRTLPDDHPTLQRARQNLAATLRRTGDLERARTLDEQVLEARTRTLPEDHPDLVAARLNLADILALLGDLEQARDLGQAAVASLERTLPDHHPDLLTARQNLASTLAGLGELDAARALEERVLAIRTRTLPADHGDIQSARINLAVTLARQNAGREQHAWPDDDRERFVELCDELLDSLLRTTQQAAWQASRREAEERNAALDRELSLLLSVVDDPLLEDKVFRLTESIRSTARDSARIRRSVRPDPELLALRGSLRESSLEVTRLSQAGASRQEFDEAVARRDALERDLILRIKQRANAVPPDTGLDAGQIAERLDTDAALITYRSYVRIWTDREQADQEDDRSLIAFLLRRGFTESSAEMIDLGPMAPIEQAVLEWRRQLSVKVDRGVHPQERSNHRDAERQAGVALRRLVFDPLLPRLDGIRNLLLTPDGPLLVVPLDALPWDGDREGRTDLLGQRYRIEHGRTIHEFLAEPESLVGPDLLVALGAASFNSAPRGPEESDRDGTDEQEFTRGIPDYFRDTAWERGFAPLTETGPEARGIAALFEEVRGIGARVELLEGSRASRAALEELAPRARWLHLATHGWYAPKAISPIWNSRLAEDKDGLASRSDIINRVSAVSAMITCGLALAGANRPRGADGRYPGLINGEEIATWDLSNCELAVLSACDTNVGLRRAGQGVASLQKALHLAGARSVVTSLWKVPDRATRDLMLEFYRRIWVLEQPKAEALWAAKMQLRDAADEFGRPVHTKRDWAGWVLTGDSN